MCIRDRYGGYQYDSYHSIDTTMHVAHYLYGSCPEYNATITITGSHAYGEAATEVQGNMTFEVAFEDPAGNVGANVNAVTRQTSSLGWVTVDTVAPALSWVDMVSNNVKHKQLAKEGDTIFLTMNATEWIDHPNSLTMAGRSAETVS